MDASEITAALTQHGAVVAGQMAKFSDLLAGLSQQVLDLEQKGIKPPNPGNGGGSVLELAELVVKDAGVQAFLKKNVQGCSIDLPPHLAKSAIVNATGQNQPLVPAQRLPGIVASPQRTTTVRSLLPVIPVTTNMVEFTREATFTNNAGPQGGGSSPAETEGQVKPESAMTFELATAPIVTVAHWIPASRQVLMDAPSLTAHIDQRLRYGVMLEEDDQLLNGNGLSGNMNGLLNQATAYNAGTTGDQRLDTLLKAATQLAQSEYTPTGFIVSQVDWLQMQLLKDGEGRYLFGNPADMVEPRLWGLPAAVTNAMSAGTFAVIDGTRVGAVFDREAVSLRIAEQHADFFVRNMVAILVEERIGFGLFQAGAIVKGTF
jgi:HK97 family phage major capsid protein